MSKAGERADRIMAWLMMHGWQEAGMTKSEFPKPRFRRENEDGTRWFVSVGGRKVFFYSPPANGQNLPFENWPHQEFATKDEAQIYEYANSLFPPPEGKEEKWIMW